MSAGTARHYFGKIWLDSKPVPQRLTTAERIRMGMSLVPEDRKRTGIFPISSVASNLTIASLWRRLQRGVTIANKEEEAVVASTIGNLSIKVSSPEVEIQALSGGNQQKVVIGRSLLTNPKVLFLDEPTRGIDIGAKGDVFRMMVQLSQQGMAVVFSTSDLKEIMAVSDRILVMSGGKLTADIVRDQAEESALVSASAQGFQDENDTIGRTGAARRSSLSRENILLLLLKLRTFIALFLIVGFFTMTVPGFLSAGSMVIMIKHIAINAFLALGITFVIITAGIDLSIGATLGLCGMIAGWLITKGIVLPMFGIAIFPSVWVIVPLVLLIGALIGAVNGWIITRYNVAPFICTLGTMYVLRGAAMLTSDGQTFPGLAGNPQLGNTGFDEIGAGALFGIPWAIWLMILLALIIAYIARRLPLAAMFMRSVTTSAPPSFPA